MSKCSRLVFGLFLMSGCLFGQGGTGVYPLKKIIENGRVATNLVTYNLNQINTSASDFAPAFYEHGLVFVSGRGAKGPKDKATGESFFSTYFAELDPNGRPLKPRNFSIRINTRRHDGPLSFSEDSREVFFSRNTYTKTYYTGQDREMGLDLFSAVRSNRDWTDLKSLGISEWGTNAMHPALSPDGDCLYFVSDREGGVGGYDLYVSHRSGKSWLEPENLGTTINTPGREGFPFVHPNGMLFFASDGREGMGGFDLYMVDLNVEPRQVIPLGSPFNSSDDDFGFILNQEATRAYFSSNRPEGFGKDDIYLVEAPIGSVGASATLGQARPTEPSSLELLVTDAQTFEKIAGAKVYLNIWKPDDGSSGDPTYDILFVPESDGSDGFVLEMIPRRDQPLGEAAGETDGEGRLILSSNSGEEYWMVVEHPGYISEERRIIFPEAEPRTGIALESVSLRKGPCVVFEGLFSSSFNRVAMKDAVVTLINQCNQSREQYKSDENGKFTACLVPGCNYQMIVRKVGYKILDQSIFASQFDGRPFLNLSFQLEPKDMVSGPIQEGQLPDSRELVPGMTIIFDKDFFFDFNSSQIRVEDLSALEALAAIMRKNPKMEIELSAHTDTRGEKDYNALLSLRRAEAVKNYLILSGIDTNRINAIGYGDTRPRNKCVSGIYCTEEEHEFNRRTEVKILKMN